MRNDARILMLAPICVMLMNLSIPQRLPAQSPGADSVVAFVPGEGAGFGADSLPRIVLGLPQGAGKLQGSRDVLSLGVSGEITLYFDDNIIVDGPGPDFTVFENPFWVDGDSLHGYIEAGVVEVSQDGVKYYTLPFDFLPDIEPPGNPDRYIGFAGVNPVMSNDGSPDPTDPLVSGGDQFDLDSVGIPNASYIRITDTGYDTYDDDGDLVSDTGFDLPPQAGFDLDAVCHINWTSRVSPFEVLSAKAISSDQIRIKFSMTLQDSQEIPPSFFSLDGVELDEGDSVIRISDVLIELQLEDPMPVRPLLSVSQWMESMSGENLIDSFDSEIEWFTGIEDEKDLKDRRRAAPSPCFPNPFNDSTKISFDVQGEKNAKVSVYDMRGRLVKVLFDGFTSDGLQSVYWNGTDSRGDICPSGIYMVYLEMGTISYGLRVLHLK